MRNSRDSGFVCNFLFFFLYSLIYDPKSSDNEDLSADQFLNFAAEFNALPDAATTLSQEIVDTVDSYIRLTKAHKLDGRESDLDAQLFMDFDLQVLSWPADHYDTYATQIRQEYQHVSEENYRIGEKT